MAALEVQAAEVEVAAVAVAALEVGAAEAAAAEVLHTSSLRCCRMQIAATTDRFRSTPAAADLCNCKV